ncbi:MAG: hypothetical protein R3E66_06835 [bacterium]
MRLLNLFVATAVVLALPACGSETSTRTGKLALTGTVDTASFGGNVDAVRAVQGGKVIAQSTLKPDGTFALNLPQGAGYHIDFTYAGSSAGLVFPRQTGNVEHLFNVNGDGIFDLGTVHHIGDPTTQSYQFRTTTAALEAADGECEDGIDATTGAVCVDDDHQDEQCADDQADGETNDDVDCVDGIDAATGAECDGGPTANQNDGETNDSDVDCVDGTDSATGEPCADDDVETDDDFPTDAAVADHNLPNALGCAVEGEEEDD